MDQVTESIGNPTTLLIERIYWLGLGAFLGLALITSLIRGLKRSKEKDTYVSAHKLEDFAKKAVKRNVDHN